MSSRKVQKLMRKMRRNRGSNARFYVIHVSLATQQPAELHIREDLTAENGKISGL
jgi:hypothetical protein